jgi:HEAT repeat protein
MTMIASFLAALALVLQERPPLDSATVTRVLSQLKASDSTVCALAGDAITNGWGWRNWGSADQVMPMPQPRPTPMPMPGGGGAVAAVRMGMHWRSHELDPAVANAFRALIRDDNRCVRNIAARVLGNHGGSASYDLFMGLLRDSRADLRETGALGLGEVQDTRAIGPLSDALRGDDAVAVRVRAAWALGEIENKVSTDVLTRALSDRSPDVRRTAAWALGQIEDKQAVQPLSAALNDESAEVRRTAVWALGEIQDASAVSLLASITKDRDAGVREAAAWALGEIQSGEGIGALETLRRDQSADVRKTALWALGEIQDGSGVEPASAALKDTDPEVRTAASGSAQGQRRRRACDSRLGLRRDPESAGA